MKGIFEQRIIFTSTNNLFFFSMFGYLSDELGLL